MSDNNADGTRDVLLRIEKLLEPIAMAARQKCWDALFKVDNTLTRMQNQNTIIASEDEYYPGYFHAYLIYQRRIDELHELLGLPDNFKDLPEYDKRLKYLFKEYVDKKRNQKESVKGVESTREAEREETRRKLEAEREEKEFKSKEEEILSWAHDEKRR